MRTSRAVGRSDRAAWVTRAEAAFLTGVPGLEIDGWIEDGTLRSRTVGGLVLVDVSSLDAPLTADAQDDRDANVPSDSTPEASEPAPDAIAPAVPPVEARSVRAARARSGRARAARVLERPAYLVAGAAGLTAIALLVLQLTLFRGTPQAARPDPERPTAAPRPSATASISVGRDPFANPFSATGKGDENGGVLVKPPGVVSNGDVVAAAATVVNESHTRWLPPSELAFVARDGDGRVIARETTTVSLGPGKSETAIAPSLGVAPSAIAAIEAHIRAAPLRRGRYRSPSVTVQRASSSQDGRAISGVLSVEKNARDRATLACAMFDGLDELVGVSVKTLDLHAARRGQLRFWLTAQPDRPGPYKVSCSVPPGGG